MSGEIPELKKKKKNFFFLYLVQRIKPYYLSILMNSLKCMAPTRQRISCVTCVDELIGLWACLAWTIVR